MWKEDYCSGLLWYFPSPGRRLERSTAPTWSWVSLDAYSIYCAPGDDAPVSSTGYLYFSNLNTDCKPISENDRYGKLESARLTLTGILLPFVLTHVSPTESSIDYDARADFALQLDIALSDERGLLDPNAQYFGLPLDQHKNVV
jgi:hypothetical protein